MSITLLFFSSVKSTIQIFLSVAGTTEYPGWLILLLLTLLTTLVAESADPSHAIVLTLGLTIAIKGRFVMDEMMGVREAIPIIRYTIYSYFILLPAFIALSVIFPEFLVQITTLNG